VEDDRFLRELIVKKLINEDTTRSRRLMANRGYRNKRGKPDLILLDLILPGIDGFEVLALKKDDVSVSGIPVIILSNLGQKEDVEKGLGLGAVDYLIKAHFTPEKSSRRSVTS